MDVVDFSKYLYKKLRQRQDDLSVALAHGSVRSWEEYKMTVGEIRGLSLACDEIKTMLEKDENYDEDTLHS
jgi:hypothetical protein|tara:strand:- start:633 stop:845 length:213 start_codon:yes stop_codon:yes gene_type:complete